MEPTGLITVLIAIIAIVPGVLALLQQRRLRNAETIKAEAEADQATAAATSLLAQAASGLASEWRERSEYLDTRIDELGAQAQIQQERIVNQQAEMATLQETLDTAMRRITHLENENSTFRKETQAQQNKIGTLQSVISTAVDRISMLEEENGQLRQRIKALEEENKELKEMNAELSQRMESNHG